MLKKIGTAFADTPEKVLVEINLSSPNIPEKPPIAHDFVGMKEYLTTVFAAGGTHGSARWSQVDAVFTMVSLLKLLAFSMSSIPTCPSSAASTRLAVVWWWTWRRRRPSCIQ
jgi:hypothetical protein